MTPNYSARESLVRALVILGASTFVGALVLPLAADGTLPATWAAWRPVLAVAVSAAIVAEIAYVRAHLAAVAQAIGVTPAPAPAAPPAPAPTDAAAKRGFARLPLVGALALVAVLGLLAPGCAWFKAEVPVAANVVAIVERDFRAGDGAPQISSDVCKALGGSAPTDLACAGVAVLVQDALSLLIDSGVLAGKDQDRAIGMRDTILRSQPLTVPLPSSR